MLIGLIFWCRGLAWLSAAFQARLPGKFSDIGIDDKFIKEVGATIEPGHSALFMLVERMTEDRVLPELQKFHPTVLRTNLSSEDEAKLKAAFGATNRASAIVMEQGGDDIRSASSTQACCPTHGALLGAPIVHTWRRHPAGHAGPAHRSPIYSLTSADDQHSSEIAILSSIASGMMALTGIVFSMVLVRCRWPAVPIHRASCSGLPRQHTAPCAGRLYRHLYLCPDGLDGRGRGKFRACALPGDDGALVWLLASIVLLIALIERVGQPVYHKCTL